MASFSRAAILYLTTKARRRIDPCVIALTPDQREALDERKAVLVWEFLLANGISETEPFGAFLKTELRRLSHYSAVSLSPIEHSSEAARVSWLLKDIGVSSQGGGISFDPNEHCVLGVADTLELPENVRRVLTRWKDLEVPTLLRGDNGSGKSVMLNNIIKQAAAVKQNGRYCPIVVIDPKGDSSMRLVCQEAAAGRNGGFGCRVFSISGGGLDDLSGWLESIEAGEILYFDLWGDVSGEYSRMLLDMLCAVMRGRRNHRSQHVELNNLFLFCDETQRLLCSEMMSIVMHSRAVRFVTFLSAQSFHTLLSCRSGEFSSQLLANIGTFVAFETRDPLEREILERNMSIQPSFFVDLKVGEFFFRGNGKHPLKGRLVFG